MSENGRGIWLKIIGALLPFVAAAVLTHGSSVP